MLAYAANIRIADWLTIPQEGHEVADVLSIKHPPRLLCSGTIFDPRPKNIV